MADLKSYYSGKNYAPKYPKGTGKNAGPNKYRPGSVVTNGAKWPEDREENHARQIMPGDTAPGPKGAKTAAAAAKANRESNPMTTSTPHAANSGLLDTPIDSHQVEP